MLSYTVFAEASKSFAPAFYYILDFVINATLVLVCEVLLFQGIILHRWSAKWGLKKAIFVVCIFYGCLVYQNLIGGTLFCLILTLLYLKSRTLIVPMIFRIISKVIWEIVGILEIIYDRNTNTIE